MRISITDARPGPETVIRLAQLARDLIKLDPTTANSGSPTINTTIATTTTSAQAPDTPAGDTTTTLGACEPSSTPPLVVVVNASHVNGVAKSWSYLLEAQVPSVGFADPVNAVAQVPSSRVMALKGFDCSAALISHFITGTAVEMATLETIQALVMGTLPTGTSIVVFIGDDNVSSVTTGSTSTSAAP